MRGGAVHAEETNRCVAGQLTRQISERSGASECDDCAAKNSTFRAFSRITILDGLSLLDWPMSGDGALDVQGCRGAMRRRPRTSAAAAACSLRNELGRHRPLWRAHEVFKRRVFRLQSPHSTIAPGACQSSGSCLGCLSACSAVGNGGIGLISTNCFQHLLPSEHNDLDLASQSNTCSTILPGTTRESTLLQCTLHSSALAYPSRLRVPAPVTISFCNMTSAPTCYSTHLHS